LLAPQTSDGLLHQLGVTLATGNVAVIDAGCGLARPALPAGVAARVAWSGDWRAEGPFAAALVEGDAARILKLSRTIADLPGPLVPVHAASSDALRDDPEAYCLDWLLEEVSTSINTTAAGGNAALMGIG
ncbi:MAG: trifunctional transcriptional regulator/proline dehydrogenase/L-glutamate gamma-semialdehyde dehydrogenase, partial [Afipia sp.]|nr:trifunctional transcriptional regulator/proline dehydrogenase/L-glutamate gamma-semialdehyde dehydrogenase [Afipia sp.]